MICKMYMYVLKQSKKKHFIVHDVYVVTFDKRKKEGTEIPFA